MGVNFYYTQHLKQKPSMWLFLLYYHLVPLIFIKELNKRNHKNALDLSYQYYYIYFNNDIYKRINLKIILLKKYQKIGIEVNVRIKGKK